MRSNSIVVYGGVSPRLFIEYLEFKIYTFESPKAKSLTNYLAIEDVPSLLLCSIPVIRVCCGGTGNDRGQYLALKRI